MPTGLSGVATTSVEGPIQESSERRPALLIWEAQVLMEECVDGTQKTYDKSEMVEETYWQLVAVTTCWRVYKKSQHAPTFQDVREQLGGPRGFQNEMRHGSVGYQPT